MQGETAPGSASWGTFWSCSCRWGAPPQAQCLNFAGDINITGATNNAGATNIAATTSVPGDQGLGATGPFWQRDACAWRCHCGIWWWCPQRAAKGRCDAYACWRDILHVYGRPRRGTVAGDSRGGHRRVHPGSVRLSTGTWPDFWGWLADAAGGRVNLHQVRGNTSAVSPFHSLH